MKKGDTKTDLVVHLTPVVHLSPVVHLTPVAHVIPGMGIQLLMMCQL